MQTLQFEILGKSLGIRHFITTRQGGESEGLYHSLNLSFKAGDQGEKVIRNRALLARQLELSPDKLYFPDQCHTHQVAIIRNTDQAPDLIERDALITDKKNIAICVLAADCVPILLYDPVKGVVAAIHAGWKGTIGQIVNHTLKEMTENFGSNPRRILAGIGPAISSRQYAVGDEVSRQFRELFGKHAGVVLRNPKTHQDHLDLQEANFQLLLNSGLMEEHIEIMRLCTYANPDLFFSARRDGFHSGRFASGILLKDNGKEPFV